MKYRDLLQEYLASREWTDELAVDEENSAVQLDTGVSIGEQRGRLIVEASDQSDFVDVFFYLSGVTCKQAKFGEMTKLFNGIHQWMRYGRFELLDDGTIRWFHRVDFEGSSPTATSIHRIVQPGWELVVRWADPISAVALTKQTAEEALEEFFEEQRKQEEENSGPTEL